MARFRARARVRVRVRARVRVKARVRARVRWLLLAAVPQRGHLPELTVGTGAPVQSRAQTCE